MRDRLEIWRWKAVMDSAKQFNLASRSNLLHDTMFSNLFHRFRAWRYRRSIAQQDFSGKTVEDIFTETFRKRYWRSRESVSGRGAELGQTQRLRTELPLLLHRFGIRSLLDLPCGDFNWMQHVDLKGIKYIGGDIVAALTAQNRERYGNEERTFLHLDLLNDPLPAADCVLIRDCLVHFSIEHIRQAIDNLKRSEITYLLTTSFPNTAVNEDIPTGHWRTLNLREAPFFFPAPLAVLNEGCTEENGAFADKSLCLWKIDSL